MKKEVSLRIASACQHHIAHLLLRVQQDWFIPVAIMLKGTILSFLSIRIETTELTSDGLCKAVFSDTHMIRVLWDAALLENTHIAFNVDRNECKKCRRVHPLASNRTLIWLGSVH